MKCMNSSVPRMSMFIDAKLSVDELDEGTSGNARVSIDSSASEVG